jgi:hypothetical protein
MKRWRWLLGIGSLGLGLGSLVIIRAVCGPEILDSTKEIGYDDFTYAASGLRTTQSLGSAKAPQGEAFYIIHVRVTNHARRVEYVFRPEIYRLYTTDGRALPNTPDGQSAIDSAAGGRQMEPVRLAPMGGSVKRSLAFVGPSGLSSVRAAISTAGALGDFLDLIFGGNVNIELKT